ncbi:hypothetical protein HA397_25505, partial [Escherichia coli]|nr:hypothetical protein [Escherichia coli]
ELSALADALGLERRRGAGLEDDLARARAEANAQAALVASLGAKVTAAEGRIQGFEAQVAALLARQAELETSLSDEQAARAAEAAAAAALRGELAQADDDLTALTLALEAERQRAEDTLTLLAAARARADAAETAQLSEAEKNAALMALARGELETQKALSEESQRKVELLNQQVAALRNQLGALQALLDDAAARDAAANVQIESLGSQLNTALAQVASEQRARAALEEAERRRLEEEAARLKSEAAQLETYRSEFFGRLRQILAGREGVQIVGDRFVFSSEVLFEP